MQAVHPVGYAQLRARRAGAPRPRHVPGRARSRSPSRPPPPPISRSSSSAPTTRSSPRATTARRSRCPARRTSWSRRALAANPRTIVVVNAGAPVLLPWLDEVPCVLWAWLGGQEWPEALADVLTGVDRADRAPALDAPRPRVRRARAGRDPRRRRHRVPRGRPRRVPLAGTRLGRTPAAPFGHGLGWTTWEYEARRRARPSRPTGRSSCDVTVRNTGARDGREVVQVYVEAPAGDERPVRWLGGFAVVHAAAGEHAVVRVRVDAQAFRTWDSAQPGWVTPAGTYPIRVGRSSQRPAPHGRRGPPSPTPRSDTQPDRAPTLRSDEIRSPVGPVRPAVPHSARRHS